MRTGAQYLADICNDGRLVLYDGDVVRDVPNHPAFRAAAQSIANLWDVASDPTNRDVMTYVSPATGRPVLRCYQVPNGPAELAARHRMGLAKHWGDHAALAKAGSALEVRSNRCPNPVPSVPL
jgi:aromatic ring hydroxylase